MTANTFSPASAERSYRLREAALRPAMSRARIVFAVHPFGWGGAEKHLEDLIARADPARVEPVILSFAPNQYSEALRNLGRADVAVHTTDMSLDFWGFRRAFAELAPEVIVMVNGMLGQFPWWVYAAARMSGAKRVVALEHLQAEPAPAEAERGVHSPSCVERSAGAHGSYSGTG